MRGDRAGSSGGGGRGGGEVPGSFYPFKASSKSGGRSSGSVGGTPRTALKAVATVSGGDVSEGGGGGGGGGGNQPKLYRQRWLQLGLLALLALVGEAQERRGHAAGGPPFSCCWTGSSGWYVGPNS